MMTVHHCIEFVIDHLLCQEHPDLPMHAVESLQSVHAQKIVHKYTEFHRMQVKDRVKIAKIFEHGLFQKFLLNFATIKGTAKKLADHTYYYIIKSQARSKREQLTLLAAWDKTYFVTAQVTRDNKAFTEVAEYLQQYYPAFIEHALEHVTPLVQQHETHLN